MDPQKLVRTAISTLGSQTELAKALDCSQSTISLWKSGESQPLSGAYLRMLDLIGGDISRALPGWKPESPDHKMIEALCQEVEDLRQRVRIAMAVLGGESEGEDDDDLLGGLSGPDATQQGSLGEDTDSAHRKRAPRAQPSGPAAPARRGPAKKAP